MRRGGGNDEGGGRDGGGDVNEAVTRRTSGTTPKTSGTTPHPTTNPVGFVVGWSPVNIQQLSIYATCQLE